MQTSDKHASYTLHDFFINLLWKCSGSFRAGGGSREASVHVAFSKLILVIVNQWATCWGNSSRGWLSSLTETCHDTYILLLSRWSDCFYYSPHLYVALDTTVKTIGTKLLNLFYRYFWEDFNLFVCASCGYNSFSLQSFLIMQTWQISV